MKYLVVMVVVLLLVPYLVSAEFSYFVQVNKNNTVLSYQNLSVINGESPDYKNQPEDGYRAEIVDFHNNELFEIKFRFPDRIYDIPGLFILNESSKIFVLPYFNEGKYLNIYDSEDVLKLQIDLSQLASCNQNYVCEPVKENHETCSLDCIVGGNDGLCEIMEDGVCDPDCDGKDFECKTSLGEEAIEAIINTYQNEINFYNKISDPRARNQIDERYRRINSLSNNMIIWLIVIILIVLIAGFILYYKKFR